MLISARPQYKKPPQRHPFKFKPDKALEAVLYLVERLPKRNRTKFFVNKLLFYADLKHLEDYSRYICGDFYVAMKDGPVPSTVYNMLREIAGDNEPSNFGVDFDNAIEFDDREFIPLRSADTDSLSKSDMQCLDYALEKFGNLSYKTLWDISHGEPSYIETIENQGLNQSIEVFNMAKYLEDGDDLVRVLTGEP